MRSQLFAFITTAFSLLLPYTLHSTSILERMSLDEKAGQLLMVHFNGETCNEKAVSLICEEHIGGFILFNWSNGLTSPKQVSDLTDSLQKVATTSPNAIPLLIAIDQEGGAVVRLREGFTHFPGNKAMALAGEPGLAYECALAMGKEQLAVGINMTLAPVVDVASPDANSFIGSRSFGETPELVIEYGSSVLSGFKDAGILTTLKHYPGIGKIAVDPHYDSPVNPSSLEEMMEGCLAPFIALAKRTDAVMTGHVITLALDPDNCATFSKETLRRLREEIGFEGVIITDSLVMDSVAKGCPSVEEAALRALLAGCDLLLLGGKLLNESGLSKEIGCEKIRSTRLAIVDAVRKGIIDERQIDRSVERILKLKEKILPALEPMSIENLIRRQEHLELAQLVAELSVKEYTGKLIPVDISER